MSKPSAKPPVIISLVAVPETAPATLYGCYEVFSAVGVAWEALTGEAIPVRRMEPVIVAEAMKPFPGTLGIGVSPQASFETASPADVIIVPDLDLAQYPHARWRAVCRWLRREYARGATVCSVCTGALLLAEAGLLDGLEATTHWGAQRLFERFYPEVRLCTDRVLVTAGPGARIVTGGGYASWVDLALYLIGRYSGREEAVRIAKIFLFGDRSEGQLPFSRALLPTAHGDAAVARSQAWISEHYATATPVGSMIEHSGLTARTFKRRFRAATGYAPIGYVQAVRIEEAKRLLERSPMSTEDIGAAVGYQDPASFRRLFKRLTGVTPARYRQRFGLGSSTDPILAAGHLR